MPPGGSRIVSGKENTTIVDRGERIRKTEPFSETEEFSG